MTLIPEEAWLERIYENYVTLPIKKKVVGERICVRFAETDKVNVQRMLRSDATINGVRRPISNGIVGGDDGIIFDFELPSGVKRQLTGEIVFSETEVGRESKFSYAIETPRVR